MNEMGKTQKCELEVQENNAKRVKVKVKGCYIRIDIPGKTYNQMRGIMERAVYPSSKSVYRKAIYKALKGQEVLIRIFIQNELNAFYEEYAKKEGVKIKAEYPYIQSYREQEGSFESLFDIVFIVFIEKTAETVVKPIVEPIVEEIVEKFKQRIKGRLEKLLKGKTDNENIEVGTQNNVEESA